MGSFHPAGASALRPPLDTSAACHEVTALRALKPGLLFSVDGPRVGGAAEEAAGATRVAELAPRNFRDDAIFEAERVVALSLGQEASCSSASPPLHPPPAVEHCSREPSGSPRHPFASWGCRKPSGVSFRQIQQSDLEALQQLHEEIFPISYEMEFFLCVVHHKGILSWAACESDNPSSLVGFITARMLDPIEVEGAHVLQPSIFSSRRTLMYILTLGVTKQYRHCGVASALVRKVLDDARFVPWCQGVYLHVVAYNVPAIHFYSRLHFLCLRRASAFYVLDGKIYDAFVFVHYLNGGTPHADSFADWALSSFAAVGRGLDVLVNYLKGKSENHSFSYLCVSRCSAVFDSVFTFFKGREGFLRCLSPNRASEQSNASQLAYLKPSSS